MKKSVPHRVTYRATYEAGSKWRRNVVRYATWVRDKLNLHPKGAPATWVADCVDVTEVERERLGEVSTE